MLLLYYPGHEMDQERALLVGPAPHIAAISEWLEEHQQWFDRFTGGPLHTLRPGRAVQESPWCTRNDGGLQDCLNSKFDHHTNIYLFDRRPSRRLSWLPMLAVVLYTKTGTVFLLWS